MDVWVVTHGDMVLTTLAEYNLAVEYIERADVAGEHGEWSDQRFTYTTRDGVYRIWNQTVWTVARAPA